MRRSAKLARSMRAYGAKNDADLREKIKQADDKALSDAQARTASAAKGVKSGKQLASNLKALGATGMKDYQRDAYNPYQAAREEKGYAELPGYKKPASKPAAKPAAKSVAKKSVPSKTQGRKK